MPRTASTNLPPANSRDDRLNDLGLQLRRVLGNNPVGGQFDLATGTVYAFTANLKSDNLLPFTLESTRPGQFPAR
jgi:hypothetical protein